MLFILVSIFVFQYIHDDLSYYAPVLKTNSIAAKDKLTVDMINF